MNVIKRSGMEVLFDKNKIVNAITKAKKDTPTSNITKEAMEEIAEYIEFKCGKLGRAAGIEEIQDMVEQNLMARGEFELAKNYVRYRYKRELIRKKNTTDDKILGLIDCMNEEVTQENANKNTHINSTQRDYIAGEVNRDIVHRLLLPPDLAEADKEGLIHIHDQDYMAMHEVNCFNGNTKFITNYGIRRFNEFKDGDHVCVKDLYGNLRDAIVHIYGQQKMNIVTLKNGKMIQEIKCTANHRWILDNGSVTTDLRIGDTLWPTQDSTTLNFDCQEKMEAFCLGFVIGDGSDRSYHESVTIRLCGDKIKYLNIFMQCGYKIISHECQSIGNDIILSCNKYRKFKQDFLNGRAWRFLPPMMQEYLFKGYYAADGATHANNISTSDSRVEEFIEDCSGIAGYYYTSKKEIFHDTNFKQNARLVTYQFVVKSAAHNHKWKVIDIRHYKAAPQLSYCVEEPVTHTFTLEKGIVTGNCCLLNLEDMLQNGTVISGTKIDKPHSFSVACNISTQIMAQIASNQYGGQSISLTHLAPFVDVSRQNLKKDVIKEFDDIGFEATEEIINKITEERLMKEISKGIQTIQYQILTLSSVNGQAPFVSIFMYLNEAKNEREKKDLAIIIEEMLKQRIQGVKNAAGQWVTPAFPKLLYVLEPDNISEDQPYWYLTELAAKCTAKRMVPDYISEKIMFENKEGNCYPCMGCLNGSETVTVKLPNGKVYEKEPLVNLWKLASSMYSMYQYTEHSQFINCDENFQIYDTFSDGFVRIKKFIKNDDMGRWNKVEFENGLSIIATSDHPLPTQRGRIKVKDIIVGSDEVQLAKSKNMVKVTDITFLGYRYANEYDVETESDRFDVSGINSHNCRSFLTVWKDENGKPKFYGRENQGVCTINLPDVALSSKKDFNKFWKILDERLEMCKRALMIKHKRLEGTVADYSPIHWMYGGLARLKSGEKIDKYLHGGYSTISLGYAGLYECVKYMTGVSHTDEKIGKPFGLKIMQHLNDKCKEWKQEENIDFSVYGSPKIA